MPDKEQATETIESTETAQDTVEQQVVETPDQDTEYVKELVRQYPHLAKNEELKEDLIEAITPGEEGAKETKSEESTVEEGKPGQT